MWYDTMIFPQITSLGDSEFEEKTDETLKRKEFLNEIMDLRKEKLNFKYVKPQTGKQ
jgi:hypothetical protein